MLSGDLCIDVGEVGNFCGCGNPICHLHHLKRGLKSYKGKGFQVFHLHLGQSMAPEHQYPGKDVRKPLKHNDSLVPGSGLP